MYSARENVPSIVALEDKKLFDESQALMYAYKLFLYPLPTFQELLAGALNYTSGYADKLVKRITQHQKRYSSAEEILQGPLKKNIAKRDAHMLKVIRREKPDIVVIRDYYAQNIKSKLPQYEYVQIV